MLRCFYLLLCTTTTFATLITAFVSLNSIPQASCGRPGTREAVYLPLIQLNTVAIAAEKSLTPVPRIAGVTPPDTNYAVPDKAYFISPTGSDSNPGTQAAPWRTLGQAVSRVPAGATIVLRAGVYHESIMIENKPLTLQPYPREQVVFDGATAVTSWKADGAIWRADCWTVEFKQGSSQGIDPANPLAAYPDIVFVNEQPLRQVQSRGAVTQGTFYVDYAGDALYIGENPAGKTVSASSLSQAIRIIDSPKSTIRGLSFVRYATHIDDNAAVYGTSDGLTFEHNTFAWNAAAGLSIVGADGVVRGNNLIYNGQLGLHASHADRLLVEKNRLAYNNQERFDPGWEAGGVKITRSSDMIWRDNSAEQNNGSGLWCDVSCRNTEIVGNLIRNNLRYGIEFEISSQALIASNVIANNGTAGVNVSSSNDVSIYNNSFSRNPEQIRVVDDDRSCADLPVTCVTTGTVIRNNIFSDGTGTSLRLLLVDDYSSQKKTAEAMVQAINNNAYYRTNADQPSFLILWTRGANDGNYSTLDRFRAATGLEPNGIAIDDTASNPFFIDEAGGNYRLKPGSPALGTGSALPGAVADAIGVAPNVAVNMGALVFHHGGTETRSN